MEKHQNYDKPLIPTESHFPKFRIFLSSRDPKTYFTFTETSITLKNHITKEIISEAKYPENILQEGINYSEISEDEESALISTTKGNLYILHFPTKDTKMSISKLSGSILYKDEHLDPRIYGHDANNYQYRDKIIVKRKSKNYQQTHFPVKKKLK